MSDVAPGAPAQRPASRATSLRQDTPRQRGRRKTLAQRLNPWIRSLHLYCGVALVPFVLLYGVSAFLMNHPGLYRDIQQTPLSSEALQRAALGPVDAQALAVATVAEMNRVSSGRHEFTLVDPQALEGAPLSLLLDSRGADMRQRYMVDLSHGEGRRIAMQENAAGNASARPARMPLAGQTLTLPDTSPLAVPLVSQQARLREAIGASERQPLNGKGTLDFTLEDGSGQRFTAQLDLYSGKLKGQPVGQVQPGAGLGETLTHLHKQHGYKSSVLEWLWAVVVDVMACVMVLWGLTGLWMWWQMKRRRPLGGLLMAAGIGLSTALGLGLHAGM